MQLCIVGAKITESATEDLFFKYSMEFAYRVHYRGLIILSCLLLLLLLLS